MNRKLTLLWLVLGLGSKLQVAASLSITELIVLASAPFIFIKNYQQLKRDGVMPFFVLSMLVILGCIIASMANHTPSMFVLRGMAVTCIVACSIIFSHWILRQDPGGFKWYILMIPVSVILSTFFLKQSVEVSMYGEASEEIMSGPIFWISRLKPLVLAPTTGWYLQTPWLFSVFAPLAVAVFAIMTSTSGRSAALSAVGFAALVIIGGKSRRSINRISRHFGEMCLIGALLISLMYFAYKISASLGWLGEESRQKYERQTSGGTGGIGRLILGGRAESFVGILACRDKPIVGWGPWAIDENGYAEEFITKYGTMEDVESMVKALEWQRKHGISRHMLSCHAYITEFWAWYGIWGLVFWLYIIFVLLRYLKQDVAAVPQWYAWLACSIPGVFWGIFFSPFADRFGIPLFVVACLMARSVRRGIYQLPFEMISEMEKVERP